ncbi:hypothetical protein OE88DRAFT_371073 [Heliocybe sulcata]|uniref:C2H2-type domain-containing protein n=1 Tax=Heliocybe sulcata TaxID=5364 RepID=A0A5C3MW21_9AGAM|nr:hypothetical protein OE88DRAFT_371073 [Heliocybe sulcata]
MDPYHDPTQHNPFYDGAEDPFLLLDDYERENLRRGAAELADHDNDYLAAPRSREQSYVSGPFSQETGGSIAVTIDEAFGPRRLHAEESPFVSPAPRITHNQGSLRPLQTEMSINGRDGHILGWRSDVYASDDGMLSPNITFTPAEGEFLSSPLPSSYTPLSESTSPWLSSSSSETSFLAAGLQNMDLGDTNMGESLRSRDRPFSHFPTTPSLPSQVDHQLDDGRDCTATSSRNLSVNMLTASRSPPTLGHRHSISVPSSQYLSPPTTIDKRGRGHSRSVSQGSPSTSRQSPHRSSPYPSPHASPRISPQPFDEDDIDRLSPTRSFYSFTSTSAESLSSASSVPPPANVQRQQITSRAIKEASESRRTADARYYCEVEGCGQTFTRRSNLIGHYTAHSGERPFPCKELNCDRKFARSSDLSRHLKKVHKKEARKRTEAPT